MEISVVFKYAIVIAAFTILALGIVFGEGTVRQKIDEAKNAAIRYIIYSILDWGLMGLSIALVAVMKSLEANIVITTISMWIFDFVTAWSLLYLCIRSGEDLTLGRQYRKAYELIRAKSRISGLVSLSILIVKGVIWDGPEKLVEFWFKELNSSNKRLFALFCASFFQAIFWTTIYWLGLDLL